MNTTIICPHCGRSCEITDAIQHQIDAELLKAKSDQTETLRKEYDELTADRVKKEVQAALEKAKQSAELEKSLLKLKADSEAENAKGLREQMKQLMDELSAAKNACENAEINARQELLSKEMEIRKEAAEKASEDFNTKLREQEQTMERVKQEAQAALDKANQSAELEKELLKSKADNEAENAKGLREQMKQLMDELSAAKNACENAEINARQELLSKEMEIRKEAAEKASEDFNTKIREQEQTISMLREQLTTAKQIAEQGSQQLQGEILELDIEQALCGAFRFDMIDEVKKGEYGADVRQHINDQFAQNCGLILWECKNAKGWSEKWVDKLKDELSDEKAQIGVIVWSSPNNESDYKQLTDNIWLVKPRYSIMLATLLRDAIIKVYTANRNAEGKDTKIEMLYTYLTGGEFSNRIRTIIEAYDELSDHIAKEKKLTLKRWAAQEKTLEKVIGNLAGMRGDLQGITGKEIISLPLFGSDEEDE